MKKLLWFSFGIVMTVTLAACGGGGGGGGAPAPAAAVDKWVTNGTVNAVARSADGATVYLGGNFTQVGPRTGGFVAIDGTSGVHSATFPEVTGPVYTSAPDGAGGWYIGGEFTHVDGIPRKNLVRIRADGSLDPAWNPNANSGVYALAVSGGTVYAGGWFTAIDGLPSSGIAFLLP